MTKRVRKLGLKVVLRMFCLLMMERRREEGGKDGRDVR
jgi:hypothetical protein